MGWCRCRNDWAWNRRRIWTKRDCDVLAIRRRPQALRKRLAEFSGIPATPLPAGVNAELRPYQQIGFDFLCHLTRHKLGGILADDMGLGKTLQTLVWLSWSKEATPAPNRRW